MKRNLTQFAGPALADVWLRAADVRVRLEWELLASILCDPPAGIILADLSGVTAATFGESDLQTIYCAVVACQLLPRDYAQPGLDARESHRLRVYRLAKAGLQDSSCWDDGARQPYGPAWSDETLSALFDADFTTAFVPRWAKLLEHLATRQRDATEHLRFAFRILSGTEAVA